MSLKIKKKNKGKMQRLNEADPMPTNKKWSSMQNWSMKLKRMTRNLQKAVMNTVFAHRPIQLFKEEKLSSMYYTQND